MSDLTTTPSTSTALVPDLTRTTFPLHETVGFIRSSVRAIDQTATGLHQDTWDKHIDDLARDHARSSVEDLLTRFSSWGFSWRDVARMLSVSVPAVQKWRRGENVTGSNRLKIARLVALVSAIEHDAIVADPASWFEMPLLRGVALAPIDLVAKELWMPLVELALQHRDAASVLDEFDIDWRTKYVDDEFETYLDREGVRAIRPRV